jgi:mono/diheme cytochrome c family protein
MRKAVLIGLLLAGAAMARPSAPPAFEGAAGTGAAQLAHGDRLLDVLDCRGCHGKALTGVRFINRPQGVGVIWASNLTQVTPKMTSAELRALLTQGTHPARGDLWVMPAQVYQHLSEPDLAAIIAYLRSVTPAGEASPSPVLGPKAAERPMVAGSRFQPSARNVADTAGIAPPDAGARHRQGRYIATTACTVCHGPDPKGAEGLGPDLIVAAAYSRPEFETLMTTGVPPDGRTLHWLMQAAARENAAKLTVTERDALHAYLVARAALPAD